MEKGFAPSHLEDFYTLRAEADEIHDTNTPLTFKTRARTKIEGIVSARAKGADIACTLLWNGTQV